MRPTTLFTALTPLLATTDAYWKGINIPANLPSGACKTTADYTKDFQVMASLPGHFTSARLYASSDCNTLDAAVPAALSTSTKLLVGVWTENGAHYEAEKQALLTAIRQHGHDWIISVSVGSEDLYRKETSAATLAGRINDIRRQLATVGAGGLQVGHVDTWTAWVDPANEAVIRACDFVGTDGYPYFQSANIRDGYNVFWQSVQATRDVVNRVKPGTWVWITETGWPVSGANFGAAVPSVQNAQAYWKSVACSAFANAHTFWYTLQDFSSSPSFGVVGRDFKPLFDLSC